MLINEQAFAKYVEEKHRDAKYGDEPYFNHVQRVANRALNALDLLPAGLITQRQRQQVFCLGLCHDVLEDCAKDADERSVLLEEIMSFGFDAEFRFWLLALSRTDKAVPYRKMIEEIAENGPYPVVLVKKSDNEDHLDPAQSSRLPPGKMGLLKRYQNAHGLLATAWDERVSELIALSRSPSF